MAFWIYSSETIPNPESFGKPGYTPEWFVWSGVQLPVLNKGEWIKLPDNFYNMRHRDWRDKKGLREKIAPAGPPKASVRRGGRTRRLGLGYQAPKNPAKTLPPQHNKPNMA